MASVIAELRAELAARPVLPACGDDRRGKTIGDDRRAVPCSQMQCEQLVSRGKRVLRHQLQFIVIGGEDQVVSARSKYEVDDGEAQRVRRVRPGGMQARHERCHGGGQSEGCAHLPGVARKTCGSPPRGAALCFQVGSGSCGIVKMANDGLLEYVHGHFEDANVGRLHSLSMSG